MMDVKITAPGKRIYSGKADAVRFRSTQGEMQILPGHISYMAEIGKGSMEIRCGNKKLSGETTHGIIYNHRNDISIILFEPYEFL